MYGPPVAFHFYKHSIVIDEEYCTGCFRCAGICPTKTVIGARVIDGRKKAFVKEPDDCIGCMKCFNFCQIKAITCTRKPREYQ
ncbi:MAG: 4Fe-4S binding protein [Coriobacteriia bacterium]|nr:4Fe-4S binding protein [Coriobacteriia bacterium]